MTAVTASAPDRQVASPVLQVADLSVAAGNLGLVHDVTFTIDRGERVGLIGESGSGKSLTALSIMGLLADELHATGQVLLDANPANLLAMPERDRADLRGNRMTMVFQEPMTALNPLMRIGHQVAEVLELHGMDDGPAHRRAVELLDMVQLPDAAAIARRHPHQLSGGQRQRVMLAVALANEPDVLICDEPTTALDVTVQAQMLQLVVDGVRERDAGLLFITHDLAVVATVCERVMVMYGGRIVEAGPVETVFTAPRHPYTAGLLSASDLDAVGPDGMLATIEGSVPGAGQFPSGCVFRDRCDRATEECTHQPPWEGTRDHGHACVHPLEVP